MRIVLYKIKRLYHLALSKILHSPHVHIFRCIREREILFAVIFSYKIVENYESLILVEPVGGTY